MEGHHHHDLEFFLINSSVSFSSILAEINDCVLGHTSHFGGTTMTPPTPDKNCLTMGGADSVWMGFLTAQLSSKARGRKGC